MLENVKWMVGTLAIPAALALVAHQYQQVEANRQISEARLRLYTELLSNRESADTQVRSSIFDKVLDKYLDPNSRDLRTKLVALDLLASNFDDSLDLSALFWQINREIDLSDKAQRGDLIHQLIRIADGVKDRQTSALELDIADWGAPSREASLTLDYLTNENGAPDIDTRFTFPDPDPFAESGQLVQRHLRVWIIAHDAPRRRVYAKVQADALPGEKGQDWGFWVDVFDFPMVGFTRVSRTERFALTLREYQPQLASKPIAKVRLIYFPSARVGAKDKPFINDVITDLVHDRKGAGRSDRDQRSLWERMR
jgi:hypothetical protein